MNMKRTPRTFPDFQIGDQVAIQVGGRREVEAIGSVVKVLPASFVARFSPQPDGGIPHPFTMRFRKVDGRSIGGQTFTFAQKLESGNV